MATVSCHCCTREISADSMLCYDCQGRPPLRDGVFLVEHEEPARCYHGTPARDEDEANVRRMRAWLYQDSVRLRRTCEHIEQMLLHPPLGWR